MIILCGLFAVGCRIQKFDGNRSPETSNVRSVTIRHPNLRDSMDKNLTPDMVAKADELVKNLVVKVSSEAVNCEPGITPENKDMGENKISGNSVDSTYRFRKKCDHVITLIYVDSSNQREVLTSDKKTINLTKAELELPAPVAKVTLFVTKDGQKFWSNVPMLETASNPIENQLDKVLSEKDNNATIPVSKGQTIILRLLDKHDAGYKWGVVESQLGAPTIVFEPASSDLLGAPGTYVFTWKTTNISRGNYYIRLVNQQPFGNDPGEPFRLNINLE